MPATVLFPHTLKDSVERFGGYDKSLEDGPRLAIQVTSQQMKFANL
jgi:hypothetical protein